MTAIAQLDPRASVRARAVPNDWLPHLAQVREYASFVVLGIYLALMFLIPTRLVFPPLGAAGRPVVIFGVGLIVLWAFVALVHRGLPAGRQPVRWVLLGYLATQIMGYAAGYARGLPQLEANSADRWMIATFAMVGVALCFADGPRTRQQLDLLLRILLVFGVFAGLVGAAQFAVGFDLQQYVRIPGLQPNTSLLEITERGGAEISRVAGMASHYIEFGVVLAVLTPIAVHFALYARDRNQGLARWAVVAVIVAAVPLSVSRSGIVTLAVGMVVLAAVWSWRLRFDALVIGAVGVVLFRVVNPGVLGTLRALFTSAEQDPSVQGRTEDYNVVFPMIYDHLWTGRGAGTFMPERYVLLDNQLLNTLVSTGVVGLVGFLTLFAGGMAIARSIRRRAKAEEDRHLGQALCASIAACLVASATFDSLSFVQFTSLLFVLLGVVGALWRLSGTQPSDPAVTAKDGRGRVLPPLIPDIKWVQR